jgi:hypothetical protein
MLEFRYVPSLYWAARCWAVCEANTSIEERGELFRAIGCVEPNVEFMIGGFDGGRD